MGIPSYFSYIIKNHSNIIRNWYFHQHVNRTQFHSLYMDCNSIIYDAVRQLEFAPDFEEMIISAVISKIKEHIAIIRPSNVIYIAFDGVAPLAKMEQQRIRRYKTGYIGAIDFANVDTPLSSCGDSSKWNTAAITPGTKFMELLSAKIEYAFSQPGFGAKTLVVSAANIPGEGEHKMFQYMRDHATREETIAVYGLDSDLIMLSLFHCFACENIYIFREAPEFSKTMLPKDMKVRPNEPLFLNHRKLADCILKEMGCFSGSKSGEYLDRGRIYDYIFLCFFLGNDFLPHFPAFNLRTNGIYTLLDMYKAHIGKHDDRRFIGLDTGNVQWKWVKLFIGELAKVEHANLLEEYEIRDRLEKRHFPEKTAQEREILFDNIPVLYRQEEHYICPQERGWESRYYQMAIPDTDIKEVCINYLEGLEWVFRYYTEGCPHWRWKYRFHYPPLMKDLVQYVPDFETEFVNSNEGINRPFHPNVQLSYVIPSWNHHLLSGDARRVLEKHPDLFVGITDVRFQWTFCRYFWESHAVLREISLETLTEWDAEYHK